MLRGAVVQVLDLSQGRSVQQQLDESEERMRLFSAATHEAILLHRDGVVLDANDALLRLIGYELEELRGKPALQHLDKEFWPMALDAMHSGRRAAYKATVRHKDGHSIPVEIDAMLMPGSKGAQDFRMVVLRDITAHQQAQAEMRFMADHDALTRLPNRWHLSDRLEQLIAKAHEEKRAVAVLSIDLKHFSAINDSLGHQAGDQVLCEVARRLCSCVHASDLVARAGSDEFIVVLAGSTGRAETELLTRQMVALLEMPYHVAAQPLVVAPAIGIAVFPEDGESVEALLRNAGAARHLAKESSHQPFQFYTPALESRASRMLNQEQLLRQSIALGGFELHYQPQVRTDNGALAGFEALVRWRHPQRGLVSPEEFVALAEARGLITAIDRWVLRQACHEACAWLAQGMPRVPVSVNMSAQEFRHPDLAIDVAAVLAETGLPAQLLHIELTESTLMHSDAQVQRTLHALQQQGVQLAIDDFGTGYSSLAYLRRHPIHQLKIDRSFVTDLTDNEDDAAIVTAIVQMARSLRLGTVAEGVETPAQLALLRQLGCEMAQGYLIAPPMPAEQLLQWQQDYCHKLQSQ
ncbi:putative bifunctional diguanylate cyclase/phosphodiesterase [Comamonas endophytica]|uniref:putative bifunctional diguanylate cyclase/phosphodiesterase n=1 Tax=Comamonas endophytica TaxID=2949090 RepID=UPI003607E468